MQEVPSLRWPPATRTSNSSDCSSLFVSLSLGLRWQFWTHPMGRPCFQLQLFQKASSGLASEAKTQFQCRVAMRSICLHHPVPKGWTVRSWSSDGSPCQLNVSEDKLQLCFFASLFSFGAKSGSAMFLSRFSKPWSSEGSPHKFQAGGARTWLRLHTSAVQASMVSTCDGRRSQVQAIVLNDIVLSLGLQNWRMGCSLSIVFPALSKCATW